MILASLIRIFGLTCVAALALLLSVSRTTLAQEDEPGDQELAGLYALTEVPESLDPIKFPLWEWTGHQVTQYLAGELLKRMGYNVEYIHTAEIPSVPAIQEGALHVSLEYWVGNNRVKFFKATQRGGGAEDLGYLGIKAVEGWWYPAYMEATCPGLPDWHALNECVEQFATGETAPLGRAVDAPAEWITYNDKRVESLALKYELVRSGGEGGLITEIQSAYARKAPVMLAYFWSPHWIFAKYDLRKVDLPAYKPQCWDDPSWGVNPDATHDCDFAIQEIKKLVWTGVRDKWPAAHRFLRNFEITNETQNSLVLKIDVEGRDIESVVAEWIDGNEDTWYWWIKDALLNPGQ
ncbi:MAG: hypothetical protein FJX76_27070 [Armatimonadetes bacterium]|nr:hypothetical protein [Armatimonadota bacterium]